MAHQRQTNKPPPKTRWEEEDVSEAVRARFSFAPYRDETARHKARFARAFRQWDKTEMTEQ